MRVSQPWRVLDSYCDDLYSDGRGSKFNSKIIILIIDGVMFCQQAMSDTVEDVTGQGM